MFCGNYPWKLLLLEHAKHRKQASVRGCTKSTRRRFWTQDVSYLKCHLITRPHETRLLFLVGVFEPKCPFGLGHWGKFLCNMHDAIFIPVCILHIAIWIWGCNMDIFLLHKKIIDSKTTLHKKMCNMHIAQVSILRPTYIVQPPECVIIFLFTWDRHLFQNGMVCILFGYNGLYCATPRVYHYIIIPSHKYFCCCTLTCLQHFCLKFTDFVNLWCEFRRGLMVCILFEYNGLYCTNPQVYHNFPYYVG